MLNLFKPSSRLLTPKILVLLNCTPKTPCAHYTSLASTAQNISHELRRNLALEQYGLTNLQLRWPKRVKKIEQVDYTSRNPQSISQMYGNADLSKLPIFQGGFINFGYWPNPLLNDGNISTEQRIASSKEMYKVIGDLVGMLKNHSILEVGCGLGYGSSFISEHYGPKLVVGLDISPDQVARAKKYQVSGIESGKLRFTIGEAESMPFTDDSFDAIISVEAAQHFSSISAFSKEVARVLKPNGKLVVTSFFPTTKEGAEALNAIVPDYHIHGSENTTDEVKKELSSHLENVTMTKIGENVWHGFSKWLDQIGYHNQWLKIWPALYQKGLIDYVIYQAQAPRMETNCQPLTARARNQI